MLKVVQGDGLQYNGTLLKPWIMLRWKWHVFEATDQCETGEVCVISYTHRHAHASDYTPRHQLCRRKIWDPKCITGQTLVNSWFLAIISNLSKRLYVLNSFNRNCIEDIDAIFTQRKYLEYLFKSLWQFLSLIFILAVLPCSVSLSHSLLSFPLFQITLIPPPSLNSFH